MTSGMTLRMKILLTMIVAVTVGLSVAANAQDQSSAANLGANLEENLAITAPGILRALEFKGFSLSHMLTQSPTTPILGNLELSKIGPMQPVLANLRAEMQAHKPVGRLFDLDYLANPKARFALVGVVNRADRGYVYNNRCGEIRFIYRLAYRVTDHSAEVFSRLPMTINLVYRAGAAADDVSCANVANAWLKTKTDTKSDELMSVGPLNRAFFDYKNLVALELNLQIDRSGAGAAGGFGGHAVYLMKVYDWNGSTFEEGTLENQIDRAALLASPSLMKELKAYFLDPKMQKAIDGGTFVLPKKFLAKKAITVSPGGMARSANRPYFNLFTEAELKTSFSANGEQVRSGDAFVRRLNDSTCTGCHQTRAIGGFHFTGMDPFGKYPGNSVALPGSAHYLGDLARRHDLLTAIAGRASSVDFSRGFSARPQLRRSKSLIGSGLLNGWSSHCSTGKDPSFKDWTCAEGLQCKTFFDISDKTGMGVCISKEQKVGDPCEFGQTANSGFGKDQFTRVGKRLVTVPNAMCSPQSQDRGTKTGGFLGGNVRLLSCQDKPGEPGLPPEANCGPLPASRPGFNACIGKKNFDQCLRDFSMGVGLRGCDQKNPCRDDYICAESFKTDRGVCVPPYFLFQFRVDGHPKGDK
jgi:hypothetical protein